jgi:hypothetical protein
MSVEIYEGELIYVSIGDDDGYHTHRVRLPGVPQSICLDFKYIVVIRADEGVPHHPRHPRRPYVHASSFRTRDEAEAYAAGWSPALIARYVGLPHDYFRAYNTWALKPGWLTRAARDRYFKGCSLVGSLNLTDADFQNGITMDALADLNVFCAAGRQHLAKVRPVSYRDDKAYIALVEGAIARLETAVDPINLEFLIHKNKYLSER